jgi:hypothetical protein
MVLAGGWFLWNVPLAEAQRGMGDASGVARGGVEIERLVVSGTLEKIVTEPCAKTTGWSLAGTHLVIAAGDQETWNVHLGPAVAVESMVEKLTEGMQITVDAFRTAKLPEDACVACALTFDDEELVLRDETLRPVWAGGGRGMGGGGRGFGRGGGWNSPGPCGRGAGGGWGAGGGGGRGRGAGMGRGWGWNY